MKKTFTILLLIASNAFAHNNLFFPSDAYFSTKATPELIQQLSNSKNLTVSYHRYSNLFMACGYAGLNKANIIDIPQLTKDNLKTTLTQLFNQNPNQARITKKEGSDLKYFPLLVYNKDFDFNNLPVALKFNEYFEKEQIEKAKRQHAVNDGLESKKLQKLDQKKAKEVRALDTKSIPLDLTAFMGVEEPIVVEGSEIVFVILLGGTKQDLLDHAEKKSGLEVVLVGESVTRIKY